MLGVPSEVGAFFPLVDIPLTLGLLALFLTNYKHWANSASEGMEVDLLARLPQAKFRTTILFVSLFTICWLSNFGVWTFLLIVTALSFVVTIFLGAHGGSIGNPIMIIVAAFALREWSFGFPSLVLDIPNRDPQPVPEAKHAMIGTVGKTSGPLKPSGYIRIDNKEVAVTADDGLLIDADMEVVVTGFRNGCLRVKTYQSSPEN